MDIEEVYEWKIYFDMEDKADKKAKAKAKANKK